MSKSSKSTPNILQIVAAAPGVYAKFTQDPGKAPIYDQVLVWALVEANDEHIGPHRYVIPLVAGEAGALAPADEAGNFAGVEVAHDAWPAPPGGWPAD